MHKPIDVDLIPVHLLIVAISTLHPPVIPNDSASRDINVPSIGKLRVWFAVQAEQWVTMFAEVIGPEDAPRFALELRPSSS